MMQPSVLRASDADDLLRQLAATDISVPPPGNTRTNDHREYWTGFRLLSSLATFGDLSFPIKVTKRERPDFELKMPNLLVGLEITEATEPEYEKLKAFMQNMRDQSVIALSQFHPGMRPLNRVAMLEVIRNEKTSSGWQGDMPERHWATYIERAIVRKLEGMARPGFTLYEEDWLCIYSNTPKGCIQIDEAIAVLLEKTRDLKSRKPMYRKIFIEEDDEIIILVGDSSHIIPLKSVWPAHSSAASDE